LLQEQLLSGWSQIMHMNSLAMAGRLARFGFYGNEPMVNGLAVSGVKPAAADEKHEILANCDGLKEIRASD